MVERPLPGSPLPGSPLPGSPLPGELVRHPDRPDWGIGQVQSVIGSRITVNFENAGKLLIKGDLVQLERVGPEEDV